MSNKRFQPKYNIKKNDLVVVIAGEDKNLTTPKKVLSVLTEESRVLVEGVNMVKRHTKPSAKNTNGGIISKEAPIHISNVMLWDEKAKKPTRVSRKRTEKGVERISKQSGATIK